MKFQNYRVLFLDNTSKIVRETYYRSDSLSEATLWATTVVPFPPEATVIEVSAEEANENKSVPLSEIAGGADVGRMFTEPSEVSWIVPKTVIASKILPSECEPLFEAMLVSHAVLNRAVGERSPTDVVLVGDSEGIQHFHKLLRVRNTAYDAFVVWLIPWLIQAGAYKKDFQRGP